MTLFINDISLPGISMMEQLKSFRICFERTERLRYVSMFLM